MEGRITMTIAQRDGRSYPRRLYVTPPFRVVSVGQLRHDGGAYLMQMSTSPGVLDGDDHQIDISLEPHTKLQFMSQSYQRIFDMEGSAKQRMNITIGEGAHFSQVGHPIVPHRNSSFSSTTKVSLAANSSFLQSEIITCGRKFHGEEFEFREFLSSTEVRAEGVLRVKDIVWLNPKQSPLRSCGLLEEFSHQGTLIYQTTEENININDLVEHIYNQISGTTNIDFGISQSHYKGFIMRILANSGERIYNSFIEIQGYLWNKNN